MVGRPVLDHQVVALHLVDVIVSIVITIISSSVPIINRCILSSLYHNTNNTLQLHLIQVAYI